MFFERRIASLTGLLMFLIPGPAVVAQGTAEDYRRAFALEDRFERLVVDVADNVEWVDESSVFTFRRSVNGGYFFGRVSAETLDQRPAFDHDRLAGALSGLTGESYMATTLPFDTFEYVDAETGVVFEIAESEVRCDLSNYQCAETPEVSEERDDEREGPRVSPDGRLEAFIENYNVALSEVGSDEPIYLSRDGSEGNAYSLESLSWSPDSRRLAAYRITPGHERLVHYVESSPADQVQPLHSTRNYTKPGDVLPVRRPVLFDVAAGDQHIVDDALFPNAYSLSGLEWRGDGRAFTFEYNQRGHQVYRIIEVDAETGAARAVISEDTETFFYYRDSSGSGKKFRHDLDDGREIIWMSERDGWNHLYLYDGETGVVKNQITRGEWVVRDVTWVDGANRQIYFAASGMNPDQDPYFVHYYRIDFDGTRLTALTEADGTHTLDFSPDRRHYVVTWSRVDLPPITQLRRTGDGAVLAELGRGDHSALLEAGWTPPEVFVAKGRDGETDIWGIIIRPTNFDPSRSYPVIESIYAGPHDNHVPTFGALAPRGMRQQAELGFIVVQIDGMGTSNRSKAFHDVAWKNLKDAGFPDRILWHQAVAERYPYYDLGRVGIYGGSAGGQNAMGALLFHPDFYHVAVADNGCHDNRMDKIWWNELWMSWPLGPQYEESSKVVNAHRLEGRLLLTVAELDTNVDPSSTYQVANALIKAGKEFDLVVVPGAGHARGEYHERKRFDFFVRHILNVDPPNWNDEAILAPADSDNEP
ncbi:MAG: DPP IV N-terminal domain-containing protein [Longimicrobiales bacterium]